MRKNLSQIVLDYTPDNNNIYLEITGDIKILWDKMKMLKKIFNEIQTVWFGDTGEKKGKYGYRYESGGEVKYDAEYSLNNYVIGSGEESKENFLKN